MSYLSVWSVIKMMRMYTDTIPSTIQCTPAPTKKFDSVRVRVVRLINNVHQVILQTVQNNKIIKVKMDLEMDRTFIGPLYKEEKDVKTKVDIAQQQRTTSCGYVFILNY